MAIDQDKLTEFLHKFVGDLGATMAAGNVLVGDRLGFYRTLAGQPMLPRELAEHTGTDTRLPLRPERAVPGRRLLPWGSGRRGADKAAHRRCRLHRIPPGGLDALQHHLRGPPIDAGPSGGTSWVRPRTPPPSGSLTYSPK